MERTKCEECGGRILKKRVAFTLYGVNLGKFPAEVCSRCGEKVFDEKASDEIDAVARQKGLWGLCSVTKIHKIGTSVGVVINAKIARFMHLKQGEGVVVHPENRHKLAIELQD